MPVNEMYAYALLATCIYCHHKLHSSSIHVHFYNVRTRSEMTTCNMAHHKIEGNKLMHKFSNKQNLDNIKTRFTKNLQLTVICFKLSKWYFFVYEAKKITLHVTVHLFLKLK